MSLEVQRHVTPGSLSIYCKLNVNQRILCFHVFYIPLTKNVKWEIKNRQCRQHHAHLRRWMKTNTTLNSNKISNTWTPGEDPGFQVRGGALKKIAPSRGRRENFWGISCEKSRFYAKKSYFFQFPPLQWNKFMMATIEFLNEWLSFMYLKISDWVMSFRNCPC